LQLAGGVDRQIGFTSDTGFRNSLPVSFSACDVLVANVGNLLDPLGSSKHLGLAGCEALIEGFGNEHLPGILLLSEFGYELDGLRERISDDLWATIIKRKPASVVIPGDIGLMLNLETLSVSYGSSVVEAGPSSLSYTELGGGIRYFLSSEPHMEFIMSVAHRWL